MKYEKTRRARFRRARGMTLIEILVVITIIAMISGGVAISVMRAKDEADKTLTQTDATNIRSSVLLFRIANGSECPTMRRLREEEILDEGRRDEDAWGNLYRITCTGSRIKVMSNGPDGEADNDDDITAPKRRDDNE